MVYSVILLLLSSRLLSFFLLSLYIHEVESFSFKNEHYSIKWRHFRLGILLFVMFQYNNSPYLKSFFECRTCLRLAVRVGIQRVGPRLWRPRFSSWRPGLVMFMQQKHLVSERFEVGSHYSWVGQNGTGKVWVMKEQWMNSQKEKEGKSK